MLRRDWQRHFTINALFKFFALLLLATILLSVFLYSNIESITLNSLSSLNKELSMQANNFTSQLHQLVQSYGMQAFYTPSIMQLRESKKLTNFEIIQGLRSLKSFVNSSNFVHSIYIYNSQADYIFSTADSGPDIGSAPTGRFHDSGALSLLLGEQPESWMIPVYRTINRPGGVEEVYSFVLYEYNILNPKPVTSSLLVNVSSSWMTQFLGQLDTDTFIVNKSGNTVLNWNNGKPELLEQSGVMEAAEKADDENGYIISSIGGERYVCFYTKIPGKDLAFIKISPYEECLKGLTELRTKNFIIIALIAGVGFLFLAIMLLRLYFPFYRLISSFSQVPKAQSNLVNQKTISAMAQEATTHVRDYASMLKSEFLRRMLLDPPATTGNIEENLQRYQIPLDLNEPVYLILIKSIDFNSCWDILAENAGQSCIEGVLVDENSVFIFQADNYTSPEKLCWYVSVQSQCLCAYSLPIDDIRNLKRSYGRMLEVLKLHFFFPESVLLSEEILLNLSKENVYPDIMEAKLLQALRAGSTEKAKFLLIEIIKFTKNYRYNVVTFIFKRLYLTVADMLFNVTDEEDSLNFSADTIDNLFARIDSLNELEECFSAMFEIIAEKNLYNKRLKTLHMVEQVKEYIKKNYANPMLSSQSIADDMDISPDYLGKLFRSCETLSISKYLNCIRMEQAKKMLIDSDLTVKEIAGQVGIENVQYFFTLFKNNINMTPTEFRNRDR